MSTSRRSTTLQQAEGPSIRARVYGGRGRAPPPALRESAAERTLPSVVGTGAPGREQQKYLFLWRIRSPLLHEADRVGMGDQRKDRSAVHRAGDKAQGHRAGEGCRQHSSQKEQLREAGKQVVDRSAEGKGSLGVRLMGCGSDDNGGRTTCIRRVVIRVIKSFHVELPDFRHPTEDETAQYVWGDDFDLSKPQRVATSLYTLLDRREVTSDLGVSA